MPQVRISEVILVRVNSSENLFFRRLTYYSIMPRTKKGIGKKTSGHPTGRRQKPPAPITIRSMISAETRDKSRTQEETSRTTKTVTKRQSALKRN